MTPGPLPQRERRRRNKPTYTPVTVPTSGAPLIWPPADDAWPAVVRAVYESLPLSAQASQYEPSDVNLARLICTGLAKTLTAERWSPTAFAANVNLLDGLGASLGARLRMRLEVERPGEHEPPSVDKLRRYRVVAGDARA